MYVLGMAVARLKITVGFRPTLVKTFHLAGHLQAHILSA